MLNPDTIFAVVYAYFQSAGHMFNNYLVIFMVYSIGTYAGEIFFKYEARTYWYDRLITPIILFMYLLHSYLLFDGVQVGDFWYNSGEFFNWVAAYTNALTITWYVFIVAFIIYWIIRLMSYGVYLRIKSTPARVIKALPKFNRLDAFVVLTLIVIFITQGYGTYQNAMQYKAEKAAIKAKIPKADLTRAQALLKEVTALMEGQKYLDSNKSGKDTNETSKL